MDARFDGRPACGLQRSSLRWTSKAAGTILARYLVSKGVIVKRLSVALLAGILLAATPAPTLPPPPPLPTKPLHDSFTVLVNNKGQVVRVAHGDFSGDRAFDTMMLGNAMQMWIRKPDGSAIAGTYRVSYRYDPTTKKVARVPSLISAGGSWANSPGAATLIVKDLQSQARAEYERLKAEKAKADAEKAKNLPDINAAVKHAMHSPTASPRP